MANGHIAVGVRALYAPLRIAGVHMTTFDDREQGFENKFAHDEEVEFKATARRNRALGLWAAGLMGLEGDHLEEEYEHLNGHHDLFDLAEAGFSVSLALYGIAALTRRRWLLFFAILVSGFGLLFGIGGFAGWSLHLGWLGRLLG